MRALADLDLEELRALAAECRACPLWEHATQTVFGEGPSDARVVLVGEQPGDKEDLAGHPFVGPAGALLDTCLGEAGIDRSLVYVTNAVKHFKWIPSGPRRLHQKPTRRETMACRHWLEAEMVQLKPLVLVLLGATAAQSVLGPEFRLTQHRGEVLESAFSSCTIATLHPSAVLRARDEESRVRDRASLVADLQLVAKVSR